MENAMDHGSFHEGDHSGANDCFGVNAGIFHSGHIVKIETRNSFHHQDAARHQSWVRAGNDITLLT